MLEHLPHWLGQALGGVRAGKDGLAIVALDLPTNIHAMRLTSLAFADGARLPERFTADGEGRSPPLLWTNIPQGTASLALIVEDADAPTPRPIVHAIVAAIDPDSGGLDEGAIVADGAGDEDGDTGRNSYFGEGWLPPDPPNGHGRHHYVFQLFALAAPVALTETPGRSALIDALRGNVIGAAVLTATYSRGEDAPAGPAGAGVPA